MLCPECGHPGSSVSETRARGCYVSRRRICDRCGHRHTTTEVPAGFMQYLRRPFAAVHAILLRGVRLRAAVWRRQQEIAEAVRAGGRPVAIARRFGVHRNTVYRAMRERQVAAPVQPSPTTSAGADLAAIWGSVVRTQQHDPI